MKTNTFKIQLKTFATICLIIIIGMIASHVYAEVDNNYTPLAPLPDLTTGQLNKSVDFNSYVTYVFNLLIALGAVAAVFMITWGGFEYMTSDAVNSKKGGDIKG